MFESYFKSDYSACLTDYFIKSIPLPNTVFGLGAHTLDLTSSHLSVTFLHEKNLSGDESRHILMGISLFCKEKKIPVGVLQLLHLLPR